jgi:2-alkenal reductase
MLSTHKKSWIFALIVLIMASLACQLTAVNPADLSLDREAIVRDAVATIEARGINTSTGEGISINTSLPTLDINSNLEDVFIDIYRRANPAVVHIFVLNDFGGVLGTGSGFVIDTEGHIVTNNHVVANSESFEIAFSDGFREKAQLIGTDVDSDLAVLQVEQLPPNVTPLPLGNSNDIEVGQFVITIGNPFGEEGSMSVGIVSGLGRSLDSLRIPEGGGRYSLPRVIQTDAAINPGNSGGPLLNLNGEVIGVNSAIRTDTGTNSGVGFSIPVNAVHRVAPALIRDGVFTYPYIGISMAPPLPLAIQEAFNLPPNGVYITSVVEGTPAEKAGLIGSGLTETGELAEGGDYIIAIDGNPVKDSVDLTGYLVFEAEVGQTITLTVIRDGEQVDIPLTLGARP